MRVLIYALVLAACGDNALPQEPLFAGLSGSRIKLQWYLYQDGARELDTTAFYDAGLHARCAPLKWGDDTLRCVPPADDTVFTDADCTTEIGRSINTRPKTHFIGYDWIAG